MEFTASSKTIITVFGCFEGVSISILNIDCNNQKVSVYSSRMHQSFHEFEIIFWKYASCISSISLSHMLGSDIVIIPFNNQMHNQIPRPSLSIRANIIKIEPESFSSALIKVLTVMGAGFSNIQVDWGVCDYPNSREYGLITASMASILFTTSCESISTELMHCKVPDWTKRLPAGLSSLSFYDSDTGMAILTDSSTIARVQFLPLMTGFNPNFANAIGGCCVTLQGFGFDSSKNYSLQNVDIQERNLLFKLVNASILFLEFQVPRWSAGPVKTVYIDLKDDSGYSVLNQMVEFHFKSNILKLFPTRTSCLQSSSSLITLIGLGFSPDLIYTATFSRVQLPSIAYQMNSTCLYKNPQKIVCQQVDWCLINSATLLSVSIIARDGVAEYDIMSMTELEIEYWPHINNIWPDSLSLSGSGSLLMTGKGFPINSSAVQCIFKFKDSTLHSTVTMCNASIMVCDVPSWGLHFAAQTALVSFASDGFTAPLADAVALEFLSSVSSLHPSVQSIYGGTLLFIDVSGLDDNSAKQLSCVFLQAAFRSMTPLHVHNPGSGSCSTPFWTAANLANRSYEVWLNYGENAMELYAGIIILA
jgi:hypothetical protein